MPCAAGYTPVTIEDVAAGVIDGKIVTERSCIEPASASRFRFGSLPVWMAGQTTRGDAASMTTSSTFTPGRGDALLTDNTRAPCVQHEGEGGVIRREEERQPRDRSLRRRQLQDEHEHHHAPQQAERQRQSARGGRSCWVDISDPDEYE